MTATNHTSPARLAMRIVASCVPDLQAGRYVIQVQQTVKRGEREISKKAEPDKRDQDKTKENPRREKDEPTFTGTSTFSVAAPRFTLPSSEIYSMYPPADALGHFSETLPQVVFRRRTLPWERKLAGTSDVPASPWIALLLLDEDELGLRGHAPLSARSRSVKDVVADRPSSFAPVDPWEPTDSPCQVLEIPWTLFDAITPAWGDLPYLAHARQIGSPEQLQAGDGGGAGWTPEQMEAEGVEDGGWFSVVVGNRLPAPGKEHRAFLVSLEGLEGRLRRESDTDKSVRLVVLATWRFVDDKKTGFRELVTTLPCGAMRLAPGAGDGAARGNGHGPGTAGGVLDQRVADALDFGYVPIEHQTRDGHHTVSWYRGPLVPHFLPTSSRNAVFPSADAALRYDPTQGLLDVSYAAAWQLGRLLGLQNQPFARAVQRLKLAAIRKEAAAASRKALENRFGVDLAHDWDETMQSFLRKHPLSPGATAPSDSRDRAKATEQAAREVDLPLEMRQFLGRLFLLHGVPARYLVPHPRMLEAEALRIFYLDTSWIGALIDGALSIGRVSKSAVLFDKAMAGNFLADVVPDEVGHVDPQTLPAGAATFGDPSVKEIVGHLTGFLLRSALVSGWRGMEIRVSDAAGPLRPLRLQRIASDTLLGIYPGQIKRLVIAEPPHGVHIGVTGRAGRTGPQTIGMWQLAKDQALADKPAEFAAWLLVRRVEHTIDVTIQHG